MGVSWVEVRVVRASQRIAVAHIRNVAIPSQSERDVVSEKRWVTSFKFPSSPARQVSREIDRNALRLYVPVRGESRDG